MEFSLKNSIVDQSAKVCAFAKNNIMFLFGPKQQDPLLPGNCRQEGPNASSEKQQGRHRDNISIIVSLRAMDLSIIYDRLSVLERLFTLGIRMNCPYSVLTGTGS